MHQNSTILIRLAALAFGVGVPVAGFLLLLGDDPERALQAGAVGGLLAALGAMALLVGPWRRVAFGLRALGGRPLAGSPRPAGASAELAALRVSLREAEWRAARSAAVGVGVSRISHDLRGILSPAMLASERVQIQTDPSLRRSGEVMMRAVERATETLRHGFDFIRESGAPTPRTRFSLRDAVSDAATRLQPLCPGLQVTVNIDRGLQISASYAGFVTAMTELLRNADEAGARHVVATGGPHGADMEMLLTDDGPGLPDHVRTASFNPVAAAPAASPSGFGLAIARDLLRAEAGELVVTQTGPHGTTFKVTLPAAK